MKMKRFHMNGKFKRPACWSHLPELLGMSFLKGYDKWHEDLLNAVENQFIDDVMNPLIKFSINYYFNDYCF